MESVKALVTWELLCYHLLYYYTLEPGIDTQSPSNNWQSYSDTVT